MTEDQRIYKTQANAIKSYVNKVSPISTDRISQISACLGFRWLPKFLNNRIAKEPTRFAFADWTGIWVTSATGLLSLSYGGTTGFKIWLIGQGIGNGISFVFYTLTD